MIRPNGSAIIPMLLGLFFISACAHTTAKPSSPSFQAGSDAVPLISNVSLAIKDQKTDESKEDSVEEDPFEEDPFEEDPFGDTDSDTQADVQVADPLIGWNRIMFHVNDKLYFWVLKPVARGYRAVMPTTVRVGLKNFYTNILGPLRFVNCLLQNKGDAKLHLAAEFDSVPEFDFRFAGKSDDDIRGYRYIRYHITDESHCPTVIVGAVTTVHPGQDAVTAALEGKVKMGAESPVTPEINKCGRYLRRLERGKP